MPSLGHQGASGNGDLIDILIRALLYLWAIPREWPSPARATVYPLKSANTIVLDNKAF